MVSAMILVHSVLLLLASTSTCMQNGVLVEAFVLSRRRSAASSYRKPPLQMSLSEDDKNKKAALDVASSEQSVSLEPVLVQTKSKPMLSSPPPPPPELTPNDMMRALGTSPRRIFLSLISGTVIPLGGNLFGVTSQLLTRIDQDVVEATGLDTYFPRGDYKRFRTLDYTFILPAIWVADTSVELAKAQRMVTSSLDYSMSRKSAGSSAAGILPDAAFGPPGRLDSRGVSQGDTNVSVIRTDLGRDFSLPAIMKSPFEGASVLLDKFLAPPGSGRAATLLDASEKEGMYQFSYRVERQSGPPNLQAISVLAQKEGVLFTLTVVAPEEDWPGEFGSSTLARIASSFHLR